MKTHCQVLSWSAKTFACSLCTVLFSASAIAHDFPYAVPTEDDGIPDALAEVPAPEPAAPEQVSLRGQFTYVVQYHPSFESPYSGANSLYAGGSGKETADVTLYAGARLWRGAEFYINPEIDQGFGLSNTLGVAGFLSGEAYKVGSWSPYLRVPRVFIRQTFDLGGATEAVESGANQLAGARAHDNVVLTIGKFSVVDIFDANAHAHDPRADFLNWSIIDAGAFDYAADAWGYTYGAAAEWTTGDWTFRGGFFDLSGVPNGKTVERNFGEYEVVAEVEERHELGGHNGKAKLLAFVNRGRMARYDDAVQLAQEMGGVPDVASVRKFASKSGFAVILEQDLAQDVGAFVRASANDGSKEAYEFTEINRSITGGLSVKGSHWSRANDTFGLAAVINELSAPAQRYFAAGGLGILIGDGLLPRPGQERIAETYYAIPLTEHITITADYQYVANPAYNRDRGPVSIIGARLHGEF
ncbi:MAG TPA: carbohydrate porin [Rhodanobacteraceae bacterium]|nr:carbohydrate porin [Rhodanobacteraceae bacterium]